MSWNLRNLVALFGLFFMCVANGSILDEISDQVRISNEKKALIEWVMENAHYKKGAKAITEQKAARIVTSAYSYAAEYEIDPLLVLAVAKNESGFRDKVTSSAGAKGMMQVIPKYHQDKLKKRDPYKISVSIEVGTMIIKEYLNSANNNMRRALNKYSGGGGKHYYGKIDKTHKAISRYIVEYAFANELQVYAGYSIDNPRLVKISPSIILASR